MREATIDIGTNTILLLAAEVQPAPGPKQPRVIAKILGEEIQYPRLGQGVHSNRMFAGVAMDRAKEAFALCRRKCDEMGVQKIRAVATSASRDAKNSKEFFDEIQKEFGIEVQIISGDAEARLTFLGGLLPFSDPMRCAVLDIGGGSTEFVTLSPEGELDGQSIDMGCVRATELFLSGDPYTKPSLERLEEELRKAWKEIEPDLFEGLKKKDWIGVAGTPTTLAGLDLHLDSFTSSKIDGYRLTRCHVSDWYESLALQTNAERARNPIMGTGRADIMVAGVAILMTAMETFEREEMTVSCRGLRHGVMLYPELLQKA